MTVVLPYATSYYGAYEPTPLSFYGDLYYGAGALDELPANSVIWLDLDGYLLGLHRPEDGWHVTRYDLGHPVHRDVVAERTNAHGTDDSTAFAGGRNVVIALTIEGPDRQGAFDLLAPFLAPDVRPWLYLATEPGASPRGLRVRASGDLSAPWERPSHLDLTVGFRTVGSPFWLSRFAYVDLAWPNENTPGFSFDVTFPVAFPSASGMGPATIEMAGNAPAEWTARIFGPITNPRLAHQGTGKAVAFTGLTIASGDYLTVDSTSRTALLNGETTASRYSYLDFAETEWWQLEPGFNTVHLHADAYDVPSQAEFTYHYAWW